MANKERLLELADLLEAEELEIDFDMSSWRYTNTGLAGEVCGTAACIGGTTVFHYRRDLWDTSADKYYNLTIDYKEIARKELDLTEDEADRLFTPLHMHYSITRADAVAALREFAQTGKVQWSALNDRIYDSKD